ncbi:SOS response associated peptidase (SRAP) [Nitrosospira multiformis]|uniref:Abasic site processing protein n=1 Tax=Nitrosospira multiformis TaxID=1231 RepID=A0A1I7I3K0_9PROT|nr:SOS response-associated peptidase family protein [Nitrosospira multiformis]SFU67505.1 SOS response associated peptidase (SRAP) [Nitrosospira multiformis]
MAGRRRDSPVQRQPWQFPLDAAQAAGDTSFRLRQLGLSHAEGSAREEAALDQCKGGESADGKLLPAYVSRGRVIIPGGGWFEWTLEGGKKQPWYISRRDKKPIFMAGITNCRPGIQQAVEVGFVIVTEDSGGGMVDIHDRRPVVLEPEDAWRWMDPDTPVEEAAHIAQSRSLSSDAFTWWKVGRALNLPDPNNNRKELLEPINAPESA